MLSNRLHEHATKLRVAGELARQFTALIRGDAAGALGRWIADATGSDLDRLAKGIARDIDAVKAAITYSWRTSPVEGRINRLKTLECQMYGRAGCELLQNRLLAAT